MENWQSPVQYWALYPVPGPQRVGSLKSKLEWVGATCQTMVSVGNRSAHGVSSRSKIWSITLSPHSWCNPGLSGRPDKRRLHMRPSWIYNDMPHSLISTGETSKWSTHAGSRDRSNMSDFPTSSGACSTEPTPARYLGLLGMNTSRSRSHCRTENDKCPGGRTRRYRRRCCWVTAQTHGGSRIERWRPLRRKFVRK